MQHEPAKQFRMPAVGSGAGLLAWRIRTTWLAAAIVGCFGLSQLLLWRFLGVAPAGAYFAGALAIGLLCWLVGREKRRASSATDPTVATCLVALAAAAAMFILGGEGRLLYANIDWQVRDAVLRDLAVNPWPFAYAGPDAPELLRAPLGMYFVPALAFKQFGPAAGEWALLAQNSLLLATLLTLAGTLFSTARQRAVALAVFLVFSGLDAVGAIATGRWSDHLDIWGGVEFSSTLTLAFWVPHHALAGWAGAVAYLLWSRRQLSLRLLLMLMPLLALWSPLALIGAAPFAVAGIAGAIARKELQLSDLAAPALALSLSLPGLAYLAAAPQSVGAGRSAVTFAQFLFFQFVETLPYLVPLAIIALRGKRDTLGLATATLCLMIAPWLRVGASVDLASRATIPALAVVAFLTASALTARRADVGPGLKLWLIAALGIGSVTGAAELARAATRPPAPKQDCSFVEAWALSFPKYPNVSYLAPVADVPAVLRPIAPAAALPSSPGQCSFDNWYRPLPPDAPEVGQDARQGR